MGFRAGLQSSIAACAPTFLHAPSMASGLMRAAMTVVMVYVLVMAAQPGQQILHHPGRDHMHTCRMPNRTEFVASSFFSANGLPCVPLTALVTLKLRTR